MLNTTKKICVLGGIYFTISYIIDLLQDFFQNELMSDSAKSTTVCLDNISMGLFLLFVILFFMVIFKKEFSVLCKFIDNFPKFSTYLYYIGLIGYILLIFDMILLTPTEFMSMKKDLQTYIILSAASINIVGILLAFVLATRDVFIKHKTISK